MTFAQEISWAFAGMIVLILTLDLVAVFRRSRQWKRIGERQARRDLRREWNR